MPDTIKITNASENNLKHVSLEIPRNSLVVVTGLSGSGKSSLAFDTVYAEGQRRYMETLSAYARQFMGILERPAVESITGLSPVISIEQKSTSRNPRSTVGTLTEIYDFFRLLYARIGRAYSPVTGKEMVRFSEEAIVRMISEDYSGRKAILLAPVVKGRKGHYRDLLESFVKKGFSQVRVDGSVYQITEVPQLDRYRAHFIDLVVDKVVPASGDENRIRSSVELALKHGKGVMSVLSPETGDVRFFSRYLMCPESGISFGEPAPHLFSFNSPQGACPHCKGLGHITEVDMSRIIPDRSKSIAQGGIRVIGERKDNSLFRMLEAVARKYGFSLNEPISELPEEVLSLVLYGSDELFRISDSDGNHLVTFPGVLSKVESAKSDRSDGPDEKMGEFTSTKVCPVCNGSRLKEEALCYRVAGKRIDEVSSMDISALTAWVESLPAELDAREMTIASDILKEIKERLSFLLGVGLEYLSLSRETASLSGGESQRIRLATQIGSKLVNVLYILDEPSIGLHQRDNMKLISSLRRLCEEGNSVMVVEHDEDMIRSADWLVDMGPGAGDHGGNVLYSGTPEALMSMPEDRLAALHSFTADYLRGIRRIPVPETRRKGNGLFLELKGACGNNLKNVDFRLPLGMLVGISGVSGSGKSSLVNGTLVRILSRHFYRSQAEPLPYASLEGIGNIDKLILIDQSPIGRSPRSNPATYTGVFTEIRKLFEETPDARIRGFKSGRFSFNVSGGRCEACKGAGFREIEMNFLPSVLVKCEECGGRRYKADTLAVRYKGKSISDVLEMTISAAAEFFEPVPSIYVRLKALCDVGLGYIKLGHPAVALSGGESQRVKLAGELSKRSTGNTLYVLDEPTTGLHFEDVRILMEVLQKIVSQGNTVVVIEHNIDVLRCVDYLFDLGPEGGRNGGMIIAQGTPEEVAACSLSYTGRYL